MVKKGKYVTLPRYHAGASFLLRSKSVEEINIQNSQKIPFKFDEMCLSNDRRF